MFHGVNMCFKKFYFELCIFKINIKIDCFNYFSQFKKRLNSYIRLKNSIKGGTRDKRKEKKSTGIRRNVDNRDQRIGNWERFIILEDNKASLAHFLSTEISESYSVPPG